MCARWSGPYLCPAQMSHKFVQASWRSSSKGFECYDDHRLDSLMRLKCFLGWRICVSAVLKSRTSQLKMCKMNQLDRVLMNAASWALPIILTDWQLRCPKWLLWMRTCIPDFPFLGDGIWPGLAMMELHGSKVSFDSPLRQDLDRFGSRCQVSICFQLTFDPASI